MQDTSRDEPTRRTAGRPESPGIETTENALGALIGIRYAVGAIAERSGMKLTEDDRAELMTILDLANELQDYCLQLRAIVSRQYQAKTEAP